MAEVAKKKRIPFTSPRCEFSWPRLNEPDFKFDAEAGEFSVKGIFKESDPAFQAMLKKLKPLYAQAIENGRAAFADLKVAARKAIEAKGGPTENPIFNPVYDEETEEATGSVTINFKRKHRGISKKTQKPWKWYPAIFDAKGKPMKKAPPIWSGTVGKVSFTVEEGGFFIPGTGAMGLKFQLEAVQIIELVSGGARDAKGYGFGEEDGYEAEEPGQFSDETDEDEDAAAGTASRSRDDDIDDDEIPF